MRIAHITGHLSSRAAGVKVVVEALSLEHVNAGHDVKVFATGDERWYKEPAANWTGAPAVVCKPFGPEAFGYSPSLFEELNAFDPDVVHVHGIWMYSTLVALRWHMRTRKPYILSPHGMMTPEASKFSPLKKRLVKALYHDRMIAHASSIHVTSDEEFQNARQFAANSNITLIRHGFTMPDYFNMKRTPKTSRFVLSLGRLHPVKGLDLLLDSWALVEPEFPNWSLRIVGPDEVGTRAALKKQAERLQLKRVSFEDAAYGDSKWQLFTAASLFVLPSRSENFAFTVPESLAACTPAIATKATPWSGLEEHGCGWWVEGTLQQLSQTLRTSMSQSSDHLFQMGIKGREWVKTQFNWADTASALTSLYAEGLKAVQND